MSPSFTNSLLPSVPTTSPILDNGGKRRLCPGALFTRVRGLKLFLLPLSVAPSDVGFAWTISNLGTNRSPRADPKAL